MNLYEKLQSIKSELLESNLKKSGENKFAKYSYYELADFLPPLIKLCEKHKVYTKVGFDNEMAMLTAINIEKPDETITVTSPMRTLELKGCNDIQSLGGVETYQRRYLYMAMFDIVENDMFDGSKPENDTPQTTKLHKCPICGNKGELFKLTDGTILCKSCLNKLQAKQGANNE